MCPGVFKALCAGGGRGGKGGGEWMNVKGREEEELANRGAENISVLECFFFFFIDGVDVVLIFESLLAKTGKLQYIIKSGPGVFSSRKQY